MFYATAKEMEKLDKLAVANGLDIRQMMELAGWQMLNLFKALNISKKSKILVVSGKGNKGGDGLSAARHLMNHGWSVKVILVSKKISRDSARQLRLLEKMGTKIFVYQNEAQAEKLMSKSDVLIDGLIGYRLNGPPRGSFKVLIALMNKSGKKIIAYDLPSGVDPTSGNCLKPCVEAFATLALALPKRALLKSGRFFGKTYLADIGIPGFLYDKIRKNSRHKFKNNLTRLK